MSKDPQPGSFMWWFHAVVGFLLICWFADFLFTHVYPDYFDRVRNYK